MHVRPKTMKEGWLYTHLVPAHSSGLHSHPTCMHGHIPSRHLPSSHVHPFRNPDRPVALSVAETGRLGDACATRTHRSVRSTHTSCRTLFALGHIHRQVRRMVRRGCRYQS